MMNSPNSLCVLGLTGGIGSGKSTVRRCFEQKDVPCIDLDTISREVVCKDSLGLKQVVEAFGTEFLTPKGELDRAKLKTVIFSDSTSKKTLEAILHPLIRNQTLAEINRLANNHNLVLVEIPLLAEIGKPDYIEQVIVCDCHETTQIARVMQRDGLKESAVLNIIQQQATREERLALADQVINTEQTLDQIQDKINHLIIHYQKQVSLCPTKSLP